MALTPANVVIGAGSNSAEEDGLLYRSRKKVRVGETKMLNDNTVIPRKEDWMFEEDKFSSDDSPKVVPKKSYRSVCVNDEPSLHEEEEDEEGWWLDDGWKSRIRIEETEKGPNIIILPEFCQKLAKKWGTSLIVRLLGRTIREDYLSMRLQKMWGYRGDVDTMEIGSGFFIVRLHSKEDYDFALTEGPWMIMEHYLAVQPWKSNFNPDAKEVSKIAAWIRIPKFPVDYYEEGILYMVGSQIGRVLKIDSNTLRQSKGRFARLCVEIDLSRPLLPAILINGIEKKVVYEGLHSICFSCGRYGHDMRSCSFKKNDTTEVRKDMGVSSNYNVDEEESEFVANPHENKSNEFGEWMVVPPRRRQQRTMVTSTTQKENRTRFEPVINSKHGSRVIAKNVGAVEGSRFVALNVEDSVEQIMEKQDIVVYDTHRRVSKNPQSREIKRDVSLGKKKIGKQAEASLKSGGSQLSCPININNMIKRKVQGSQMLIGSSSSSCSFPSVLNDVIVSKDVLDKSRRPTCITQKNNFDLMDPGAIDKALVHTTKPLKDIVLGLSNGVLGVVDDVEILVGDDNMHDVVMSS